MISGCYFYLSRRRGRWDDAPDDADEQQQHQQEAKMHPSRRWDDKPSEQTTDELQSQLVSLLC